MHDLALLRTLVFDSLAEQIAIIDRKGTIIDVNSAWRRFGSENGLSSEYGFLGANYLEVFATSAASGDSSAIAASQGISDVLRGRSESFEFEYPCHSPTEKRWFMMCITGLNHERDDLFVITHKNITRRKLAEERVEHLARHDPLTGLANRRYFSHFFETEMRRSARTQSPISLLLIDVDSFKDYNDELGHLAGDYCLTEISRTLSAFSRRPSDLAARLGGDEFALILGNTATEESTEIAEALRKAVTELDIRVGESAQVTTSIGVASTIPREPNAGEFLFHEADKALYRAKKRGRNRVVHAVWTNQET